MVLFATLTADFLALVGDERDWRAISLLRAIAGDADGFHQAWQTLHYDATADTGLLAELRAQRDRSKRVMAALLVADPDIELDRQTRDDLVAWAHTTRHLTALLAAVTRQTLPSVS